MPELEPAADEPALVAPSPGHLQRVLAGTEVTGADLQQDTSAETRELQERLERRQADDELITRLRTDGFRGAAYEKFEGELIDYGWGVLDAWLRRGFIFTLTARQHRPVSAGEPVRALLARDDDERSELAATIIAVAMVGFREKALLAGGWRADGGASLPTYFMNAVLQAFPNEYRRWHTGQVKWARQFSTIGDLATIASHSTAGPGDSRISDPYLVAELKELKPREAAIVWLSLEGYSQEEIMEITQSPSIRSVEGVLHRWRKKEQHARKARSMQLPGILETHHD